MAKRLADIAKKAGVSQATISRVINDKPGVSDDTREAVFKTMASMGVSRGTLQKPDSRLVAIIAPDLSNPIFPKFITMLGTLLAHNRLLPVLCNYTSGGATEESYLSMLQNQPISGAIMLAGSFDTSESDHDIYRVFTDRSIPAVFLNPSGHDIDGLYVETDDHLAMTTVLQHLTDLGHTSIGLLLGDRGHYPTQVKHEAALEFFRDHGIGHDEAMTAWTTYGIGSGSIAARQLLEDGATAIVCASDQLALGAIKAAKSLDLRIPQDVSIVGYDDSIFMSIIDPALTTVRQPVDPMSRAMVRGLCSMMEDRTLPSRRDVLTYEPELIVRQSTGPAPTRP